MKPPKKWNPEFIQMSTILHGSYGRPLPGGFFVWGLWAVVCGLWSLVCGCFWFIVFSICFQQIGQIFLYNNNSTRAVDYLLKAEKVLRELKEYSMLASNHMAQNNLVQSEKYMLPNKLHTDLEKGMVTFFDPKKL